MEGTDCCVQESWAEEIALPDVDHDEYMRMSTCFCLAKDIMQMPHFLHLPPQHITGGAMKH
jgi:hypothetical protein